MADFIVSESSLGSIANAIRERGNTSSPLLYPEGFVSAIHSIPFKGATGTFKGTVTGMAIDVPLRYDGNGYPISINIFPTEGTYNSSGYFYNTIQRYGIVYWAGMKCSIPSTPTYSGEGEINQMSCFLMFKNSTTNARIFNMAAELQTFTYQNIDAEPTFDYCVRLKNKNLMSVFIASTGYGFIANLGYSYVVSYSS